MSNRSCSKKARKVVNIAQKTVNQKLSVPFPHEFPTQNDDRVRSKRPSEETGVLPPKKIRQESPVVDDLSLDYILSDEEPSITKENCPPINQANLAKKPSSSGPKRDSSASARSKPSSQSLRAPSRAETSTLHRKQLETLPFFRGFKNLGNTCYMNAVLQALLSLSPFQTDLQNFYLNFCIMFGSQSEDARQAVASLPQISIDKISSGLIEAFIDIMGQVSAESNSINGIPLKVAVSQQEKRFADFRQQDAHEFFLCLLDQISDEVVETMKAANKLSGKQHEYKDFCPTTKNFDCLVEHSLTCIQCQDTTRVTQLYRDFSLEVPLNLNEPQFSEFKPSLQELLEAFFSVCTFFLPEKIQPINELFRMTKSIVDVRSAEVDVRWCHIEFSNCQGSWSFI